MAATVTVTKPEAGVTIIDIEETAVGASTVVTIGDSKDEPVPRLGRIMRLVSVLKSGDGTTVTPVLSSESGDFTGNKVAIEGTAAAAVDEVPGGTPFAAIGGKLYHRSTPDVGVNNVVETRYIILDGLE
jgi:hypothetical protein